MRVLINAVSAHHGGSTTYITNLLRVAPLKAPSWHFTVCLPKHTANEIGDQLAPNISIEIYPYTHTSGPSRLFYDQMIIPRIIRRTRADVLFSHTGFGTLVSPCPQILLIHNTIYFSKEYESLYRSEGHGMAGIVLRRMLSLWSVRAADLTIFPTRVMRDMVGEQLSLNGRRTACIPYGLELKRFQEPSQDRPSITDQIQVWRNEGYHILLHVSSYGIHKNLEVLVDCLPRLQRSGVRVKLITTTSRDHAGKHLPGYNRLQRQIQTLQLTDTVIEAGYVPNRQVPALYQAADLFVFPSIMESFGYPMVEAMASGIPVVASDIPISREICAEAGVYVPTRDPNAWADTLQALLSDPERRKKLATAGQDRARLFSLERYADAFVALLDSVTPAATAAVRPYA